MQTERSIRRALSIPLKQICINDTTRWRPNAPADLRHVPGAHLEVLSAVERENIQPMRPASRPDFASLGMESLFIHSLQNGEHHSFLSTALGLAFGSSFQVKFPVHGPR